MRVAMYYNNRDVRLEEMSRPKITSGELLVKVMASGICGSDVMEWYRVKKAPLVLGHEIAGTVEEVKDVDRYKPGDRVFASHHVPCNICRYCLNGHHTACETLHTTNFHPGGLSEFIRVPRLNVERGVFILPEEISFEEASFIEPLACTVRGQRGAVLKPAQSVLVLGSGNSGLLHIMLARALGAGRIMASDVNDYRLKAAQDLGADAVFHAKEDIPRAILKANKRPADLVIVCTGAISAFDQALQSVDRGGTVLFFAPTEPGVKLAVPVNDFWRNSIKLMTSYGNSPSDATTATELIRSGRVPVRKMITHKLGLAETGLGFKLTAEAKESLKVIIEPHA